MMRTTADPSKTSLEARLATISALTILADQLLRAGMKNRFACLNGQRLKIGEGLAPTLTGISAAGLLHHLMERIIQIPDLKRCHPRSRPMER